MNNWAPSLSTSVDYLLNTVEPVGNACHLLGGNLTVVGAPSLPACA
jgi:hypothetical protein